MGADGHRLTTAERATYERDGFVVRRGVFDRSETDAITHACEQLVEYLVARTRNQRRTYGSYVFEHDDEVGATVKWEGDTDVVHGIEPFAHLAPELHGWAVDGRFVDPMKDICGDDAPVLYTEKLNLKRAHAGGLNPLHQDFPYWERGSDDATRIATAMLFLDDANRENGCLEVAPGSHRLGVQPMRSDADLFGNLEMDPTPFADSELLALEVEAGAVVFFGPLLVHRSGPNRSERQRRSLLFSYQPAGHRHTSAFRAERRRRDAEAAARAI